MLCPCLGKGCAVVHLHKGAELSCPRARALIFPDSRMLSCNLALNVTLYYFYIFI